ncbi:hypothetical protein [Neobacillus mesonae]|nr:hypothetical protein [Neobacillus mesonae]
MLPLRQSVTVNRYSTDGWGNKSLLKTFTLKCRFEEGTKLTRKTTAQQPGASAIIADEVVSKAQIYLDKYVDIRMTDEIIYTDEGGTARTYLPINIKRIYGLNGKTALTYVEV